MNENQISVVHQNTTYRLTRYPETRDASLRAWSNAELLATDFMLQVCGKTDSNQADIEFSYDTQVIDTPSDIYLYNDRFGIWNCVLAQQLQQENVVINTVISYASQRKATNKNLSANGLPTLTPELIFSPLDALPTSSNNGCKAVLLKIPKSLDLFELYLQQIHKMADDTTIVVCAFMTKYFTKSMVALTEQYFADSAQTQAWKKARLLILSKPKMLSSYPVNTRSISYNDDVYQQYKGVFSAEKIDIGTQFLFEQFTNGNLQLKKGEQHVLDLACGNGVIAKELIKMSEHINHVTLVDDFGLAIKSAQGNLAEYAPNDSSENHSQDNRVVEQSFIYDDGTRSLETDSVDLIVSNPPFHFEYENNSEMSLDLFDDARRVLKPGKRFIMVANKHLDYKAHLEDLFKKVFVIDSNRKFAVYECIC